jgi:asparagine synthase (glutamine-hydrolysing)
MKTLLADEILTKVDRTSMAVGLEVRVPMLDYRLVELSARLPVSLKLSGNIGKRVLRKASSDGSGPQAAATAKHGLMCPPMPGSAGRCARALRRTAVEFGRNVESGSSREPSKV